MYNYKKNIESLELTYEYYNVESWAWYDSKDNCSFASLSDAIKYAIKSDGYFPPYKVYRVRLYADKKGKLYKKSDFLCKLPNRKEKDITYYVLGENIDGKLISFLLLQDKNKVSDDMLEEFNNNSHIGVYKIHTILKDNNRLVTYYELERTIRDTNQMSI
jgi:hypothetical protein